MLRRTNLIVIAILVAMGTAAQAPAQSPQDLKRENERLRTENADLQRELDAARKRVQDLEQRIQRLEDAIRQGGGTVPSGGTQSAPQQPQVTIDETVPDASPRALFNALKASHDEAMADMEQGNAGSAQRRAYMQALGKWASGANQRFRSSIEWHVRVDEAINADRGVIVRVTPVDPVSAAELGDAFDVLISRGVARRLDRQARLGDLQTVVMRGTLMPNVEIDPGRVAKEPFGAELIGPYAEFGFRVDVKSMTDPPKEREANADSGTP